MEKQTKKAGTQQAHLPKYWPEEDAEKAQGLTG